MVCSWPKFVGCVVCMCICAGCSGHAVRDCTVIDRSYVLNWEGPVLSVSDVDILMYVV